MRTLKSTLVLLLSILCTTAALPRPAAQASVVRALSLEDLVSRADHIVIAVAEEQQSRRHTDGRLIVTDVSLRVQRVLKGDAKVDGVLIATRLGGKLDDLALQVPGEAVFAIGKPALVFLRNQVGEAAGQLRVVGMAQGLMPLEERDGQSMVLPPGGQAALVEGDAHGRLTPQEPAVIEPTPTEILLARVAALVEAQRSQER